MQKTGKMETDLSKQAFDIYDEDGERAMMSFIVDHRNAVYDGTDLWLQGAYHLRDGSFLSRTGAEWRRIGYETRPAALEQREYPKAPEQFRALVDWPNSYTIRQRAMEQIALTAQDAFLESPEGRGAMELDEEDAAGLLSQYEVMVAAPGVEAAVHEAISKHGEVERPEYEMNILEVYEDACTEDVEKAIPPEEREALTQAFTAKLAEKLREQAAEQPAGEK